MDYLVFTSANGNYCEFLGPSSATKPVSGFKMGIWVESDSGDVHFYDDVNGWTYQFSFNEGGGGGTKSMISPTPVKSEEKRSAPKVEEPVADEPEEEPAEEEEAVEEAEPVVEQPEEVEEPKSEER